MNRTYGLVIATLLLTVALLGRLSLQRMTSIPPASAPAPAGKATDGKKMADSNSSGSLGLLPLIEEAGLCPDLGQCSAMDELSRRAMHPGEIELPTVALEFITHRESEAFDGAGRVAVQIIGTWLEAQIAQGTLDESKRRDLAARLRKIIDEGTSYFRRSAYSLLASHPEDRLPGAEETLLAEVKREDRSPEDLREAAAWLAGYQHDLNLVRDLLKARSGAQLLSGVALMRTLSRKPFCTRGETIALINELARRPDLPAQVALDLIDFMRIIGDDSRLEGAKAMLARHPNPDVRAALE